MFEGLRAEIESLEPTADGAELAELFALRDLFEARISQSLLLFDEYGSWALEGYANSAAWVVHRNRTTAREAHRLVLTAKRLEKLPAMNAAWNAGEVSGGQVATVLAGVRREHRDLFAEQEAGLVPTIAGLGVADIRRAVGHWTAYAEAVVERGPGEEPRSYLSASRVLGERVALDGDLDADSGEIVLTALRVAETKDAPGELRSPATRRADALTDVCRFFLDNQTTKPGARHRPHVNVVIQAEDLYEARRASYVGGTALEASTLQQILCDSTFHRCLVDADGAILDYGRATRDISAPLWSALVVRDEGCRFPGCDRPAKWGEAHHVIWFSRGGNTSLDNLVLLCSRHHHVLHRAGWEGKLRPDAVFEVTDPWGNVHTTSPPRALQLV